MTQLADSAMTTEPEERRCEGCGVLYDWHPSRPNEDAPRYCSVLCRRRSYKARRRGLSPEEILVYGAEARRMEQARAAGTPCPRADKLLRWTERVEADYALTRKKAQRLKGWRTLRVYACHCGWFHIGNPWDDEQTAQ
jgi:hypothetical protein